jgi:D-alanyl-D-alanine carboxypeptidase
MNSESNVLLIGLAAIFFLTFNSCSDDNESEIQSVVDDTQDQLDEFISEKYSSYTGRFPDFPGGMAAYVLHDDVTEYAHAGMDEGFTDNFHFRAQSTTKTFTAAAIMLLHQEGKLDISHYITGNIPGKNRCYIPDTPDYDIPYKDQITIWQLLCHRAGVYDIVNYPVNGEMYVEKILEEDPDHTFTPGEIIGVIAENKLSLFEPGTDWGYSNEGYVMLVKIIEEVTGKTYKEFVTNRFFKALDLTETSMVVTGTEQSLPEPFVDSWYYLKDMNINATEQNMSANIGEGNIITSLRDMARFYRLLLRGEAGITLSSVSKYMINCRPIADHSIVGYGAGLFHYPNLGYGHGGDGSGISVKCYTDPDADITIVTLFNCWNFYNGVEDASLFLEQNKMMEEMLYSIKEIYSFPGKIF